MPGCKKSCMLRETGDLGTGFSQYLPQTFNLLIQEWLRKHFNSHCSPNQKYLGTTNISAYLNF